MHPSVARLPRSKGARYSAAVIAFERRFPHIRAPLRELEKDLDSLVDSRVRAIPIISHHLLDGGGKRVRPALFFLCADAAGYTGPHLVRLGSILELIHTATLLHDDVVDGAGLRRGRPSANELYGNAASVLVGDYVYSLASVLLAWITFTGAGLQVSATISGGDSSATVIYGVEGGGDGGVR